MLCGAKIWHDHFKIVNKNYKSYIAISNRHYKTLNQIESHVFTNVFIGNEFSEHVYLGTMSQIVYIYAFTDLSELNCV